MSSLPVELARNLIVDSIGRSRAIRERSAALYHLDFASSNPQTYAGLVQRIARVLERELLALDDRLEHDPHSVTKQIQLIDDFLQDLGADLRYIEAAVTAKLPWSLSRPLEELLKRYLPDRTLMLRPQWKHNYSIHIDNLRSRYSQELAQVLSANDLDDLFAGFPTGLHIVSFPAIERKNALLHCDLAHEIGHLAAEEFLQAEPADYLFAFRQVIADEVYSDPTIEPLWKTIYIGDRLNRAVYIRRRALQELISDTFATRALGPAALFAMTAIASGQSLDLQPEERTDFYPPWRTRLRHMLDVLRKARLLPPEAAPREYTYSEDLDRSIHQHIELVQRLAGESTDRDVLDLNSITRLAYKSVFEILPDVEAHFARVFADQFIVPEVLYGQVYELVDRLVEGIPPNELTSGPYAGPATLEAIFNAAWFYRTLFLPRPSPDSDPPRRPTLRVLNRLTLKAIELAHVHREFIEWTPTRRQAQ